MQYTMAVDRLNENLAQLGDYFDPAIIKLVKQVIDAAHAQGKWVGMCGEMAGDPAAAIALLGLGLDEFSMSPASIPVVKSILTKITRTDAEKVAQQVLSLKSAESIKALLEQQKSILAAIT